MLGTDEPFRDKLFAILFELFHDEKPAQVRSGLPVLERLARRICAPPFHSERRGFAIECMLGIADPALREAFLAAPDRPFLVFEEVCRRTNDEWLVGLGLRRLLLKASHLCLAAFLQHPRKLGRLARLLGCLARPVALALLSEMSDGDEGVPPTLLRRLESLERRILEALRGNVPLDPSDPDVRHALQMLRLDQSNRRAFRGLLHALADGDDAWVSRHPATRRWYARHPHVDESFWNQGLVHALDVPGQGTVELRLERRPLEVLKMGTYVGSCLGMGGGLSYSAVATVLDDNKRVLYARDERGLVLARQLLAISEEEQLVCFSVYPQHVGLVLKTAVAEYDRALASALDLPLQGRGDYYVARILSSDWWDDRAWDLDLDESST